MLKVGIITQARMTSTRLPGKILKEVGGKPMLQYHINRLQTSALPIYIATTIKATDDPVRDFAKQENIFCYRGDEEHVLSRYYECAKANSLEVVVRVTSDCPLIDGLLIQKSVDEYLQLGDPYLYYSNCLQRTFPRGFDFEIFSFQLLEEAFHRATAPSDIEHVTPYINQNRSGKVVFKHVLNSTDQSDIRITVDTPEDFTLIQKLIEEYGADRMGYQEIINLFVLHPELKQINAHIEQKKI
jgi:spore coat polysaccharide biosynthesis protein SpsF